MRRVHPILPLFLIILHTSMLLPLSASGEMFSDVAWLKLKGLVDGKPNGFYKVVNYTVLDTGMEWQIDWNEVQIKPVGKREGVTLNPEHYSTSDRNVKNVVATKDAVSFDLINVTNEVSRVSCEKRSSDRLTIPDVKITKTVFDNTKKKLVTYEYVVTDRITLPSQEVFGVP